MFQPILTAPIASSGFHNQLYTEYMAYKVFMFIWIIFGLSYLVMVITFVQKALKSKKVTVML